MKRGHCVVVRKNMTSDEMACIRMSQQNTATQNSRDGEETAFSKALRGSKIYLKAQGFINETEE